MRLPSTTSKMGIIEDEVKALHAKLEGFETRVKALEARQFGEKPLTGEQIRMILIGPPGAGQSLRGPRRSCRTYGRESGG